IAVNDHYDTANQGHADSLLVPFKNLINDSYSRDISIKVRSNLAVKRQQGECISNFAIYGYRKDPENKNRLLIDDYAAAIVRDIFRWKIDGYSPKAIAERLNLAGVLSPMEYKQSQGISFETSFKKSSVAEWSHVAVRRILKNEIYTGVMVQG
ncbi:recombinase family protein, partial [Vibrio sp. FNV 38]|nr:recombinase family protein [Vibrio sp. FNV 38]